jgi:hypothetical protein
MTGRKVSSCSGFDRFRDFNPGPKYPAGVAAGLADLRCIASGDGRLINIKELKQWAKELQAKLEAINRWIDEMD